HETDICVIGGSCTGVFAAVRAARLGASVAIIEKQNCFGGVATAGLVNIWHSLHDEPGNKRIIAGMTQEVIDRLVKREAFYCSDDRTNSFSLNTEELKIELDELICENGIVPYLHTFYAGPHINNGKLEAIIVEGKSGRAAIAAKVFIDATGDGDLCLDLGCPSYLPESLQPPSMCGKIYGLHTLGDWNWQKALTEHGPEFGIEEDWGWGGDIPGLPGMQMRADMHVFEVDTSQRDQLTKSEIEGRRKIRGMMDIIRKYGPSNGQIGLADLAAVIGARETRRISGKYQLSGTDVLSGKKFDDSIAYGSYRVDFHHSDQPGITFRYLNGTEVVIPSRNGEKQVGRWREPVEVDPTFYQIPLRCLQQEKIPNLLMAGRMIDTDKVAFSAARVMVNMNQTGEAAGVAAYLSIDANCPIQDVDAKSVQRKLTNGGSVDFR
ncbi:MAG: FAD-dependent oxidoreductase, partial [Spirochaetales bacterium]|nr:FAD-dependent oxidoreductase [Spirochaetales bacterium]